MELNKKHLEKIILETIKEIDKEQYVKVGVSNRHIHLSQFDVEILFGAGYELTFFKDLLQPGQYACKESVTIVGPKGELERVRVLGPVRNETQVEISVTDSFKIGVKAEVCDSGNLKNAAEVIIVNPINGSEIKRKSAIIARRHIHMPPAIAQKCNFKDKDMVSVEFSGERGLVFNNVLVRVSKDFELEFHVDIDEANSALIKDGDLGKVMRYV